MSSDLFSLFQKLLINERSFDGLFCDVANCNGFNLYYNMLFKEDPVFNHAAIDDSILNYANHATVGRISKLLQEIKAEAQRRSVLPTIFVEEFWEKSGFFQKVAIEDGYIVGGSMEVMSKMVESQPDSESEAVVEETDDLKLWTDIFMSSYSIPFGWEEELIRREQAFSAPNSTKLLLARDAQKPVGCVLIHRMPPDFLGIYCVGTIPEMRHRGVARTMLRKAERMAAEFGCKYLTLQTISSDGITPMYLRYGFKLEFKRNVLLVP